MRKGVITNIINNILPKKVARPVGRWNIDYCKVKTNAKIDLANEDHCGPCGEYALKKRLLGNNTRRVKPL